jgi:hypothetical protein
MPKAKKKTKSSEAKAAVLELQNAPVAEARKEAEHATDIITLARRNNKSGMVQPRPRGRQHPDFEYGYVVNGEDASFKTGEPAKKRRVRKPKRKAAAVTSRKQKGKPGRPKGSKNKAKAPSMNVAGKRGPGRPPKAAANGAGLGQINAVVARMVKERTREVLRGALVALKKAAIAVENAI